MFGKTAVVSLLIVCITALGVISLVRDSLCELEVHQGQSEIRLNLAYEAKRSPRQGGVVQMACSWSPFYGGSRGKSSVPWGNRYTT